MKRDRMSCCRLLKMDRVAKIDALQTQVPYIYALYMLFECLIMLFHLTSATL